MIIAIIAVIGLGILWYSNDIMDPDQFEHMIEDGKYSGMNIVSIVSTGIAVIFFVVWYWILCLMWTYKRTHVLGIPSRIWVWATFFFNFIAMIALYIYAAVKGTCPDCGSELPIGAKYCSGCGKSLQESKKHIIIKERLISFLLFG